MQTIYDMIEEKKKQQLKCRMGMHVYKRSWWQFVSRCVYCGKKKGSAK